MNETGFVNIELLMWIKMNRRERPWMVKMFSPENPDGSKRKAHMFSN